MKPNRSFAESSLLPSGAPSYAPAVIRVPTHHHEEWDEPVIDPETGEPTGETEHKTRDWDTYRTEIKPTAADYHAAGYIDVVTSPPSTPAPSGYHYEASGWEIGTTEYTEYTEYTETAGDCENGENEESGSGSSGSSGQSSASVVRRKYIIVADPPPPPRRWTRLSIKTALADRGMIEVAKQYLSAIELKTGYTAWEALTDCDYIEEGYPDAEKWEAILNGAAQALGKTREEIDAFLSAVPTES